MLSSPIFFGELFISRGVSEREIITRSVIYAALAGNFEIATAISRKIDDLQLNYPVANLVIFAEAIKLSLIHI